ncbi:MAG: NeuD/PglB/VioB family sugar acetyltransferase [Longimicrobiaceae bacterium]
MQAPPREVVILGAGGTGRDVAQLIADVNAIAPTWACAGYLDDDPAKQGGLYQGLPVLGPLSGAAGYGGALFVNALGSASNHWRMDALVASLGIDPERFATIVHPTASVSADAVLGPGCIVYPHVSIISDVRLGRQVVVLANSVLNRGVEVGDFTLLASGVLLSSAITVGRCCYLGAGCNVIQKTAIGDRALVGLGAVVLDDVAPGSVVVGNPARFLRPSVPAEAGAG